MRLQLPLESDAQLAKACEPAMRALYNPSMFAQTLAALYSFSCNATGDPSSLQIVTATLVVISFVCMQLGWSAPWPAFESFDRWQRLHMAMLEHLRQDDQIDWARASIDGSSVPSPRGARRQAPTLQTEASSAASAILL